MKTPLDGPGAQSVLLEYEVTRRFGIHPSTWRRMVLAGETPSPIRLSPRRRAYLVADIESWWNDRLNNRGAA